MNKKLLTAAIGAALAAGPMLASTAVADVKVYGKVHVSIDYIDPVGSGDATTGNVTQATSRKGTSVSSNASRWGLDISEKLGGGMTAIAKLEQEIRADGDDAGQASRNRYVGLKGKFGTILAGINDTPFKNISRNVELFPEYIGDNRNIVSGGTSYNWDQRPPNVIQYATPDMNGFVATYLFSADASASTVADDNRRRLDSVGLKYAKGPLYVDLAHETHRLSAVKDGGGQKQSERGWRLGGSYNFGAFKVVGLYQSLQDLNAQSLGASQGATVSSVKRNSWGLGGAYTAGNNVFKAQYYKANAVNNFTNDGAAVSGTGTGAKMWVVGWDHLFSKTVKAYVAYAKTDNDACGVDFCPTFTVNGPSGGAHSDVITPAGGRDPSAWSVGMIVDF